MVPCGRKLCGIQDFPDGERVTPEFGEKSCYLTIFLPNTAWKLKKLGRDGARVPDAPTDPPMEDTKLVGGSTVVREGPRKACHSFQSIIFFHFHSVFYIVQNNRLAPTAPSPPGNHEYATEYLVKISKEKEQCYVCWRFLTQFLDLLLRTQMRAQMTDIKIISKGNHYAKEVLVNWWL